MSLFEWSTPERRSGDRILPIIPTEIYLHLLDHIARPTGPLAPEELRTFTNLSGVCRFFANACLPRIFEFVELSGSIVCNDVPTILCGDSDSVYRTSREITLFTQIAAGQPLALALAKTVKACCFTDWTLDEDETGSWEVRLFAKKYITEVSHMINIRELNFSQSLVDTEHWDTIATLGLLEELSFDMCEFLGGPADVDPDQRVKIKVSRLRVTDCDGSRQPVAAIDPCHLRTLITDAEFCKQADWLPQSPLTELHFRISTALSPDWYMERLHTVLMQAPKSVETMQLFFFTMPRITRGIAGCIFDDPGWKNLPLLRSLTLQAPLGLSLEWIISSVLERIGLLTNLQSFTLHNYLPVAMGHVPSPNLKVRHVIQDKLGTASNLKHVDVEGTAFHLVDGEWSEVSV